MLRIGVCSEEGSYRVPMVFCYRDGAIYLHSAKKGLKIEFLRRGNRVCFEAEVDAEFQRIGGSPCAWTMKYRSVVGRRKAYFVEDR